MIAQVRQELLAEGVAAPAQGKNPPDEAENRAASQMMAEPCVLKMLEGMKELLQRASAAEERSNCSVRSIECAWSRICGGLRGRRIMTRLCS